MAPRNRWKRYAAVFFILLIAGAALAQSTVLVRGGRSTNYVDVFTDGDLIGANPVRGSVAMGSDGTNVRALKTDSNGNLISSGTIKDGNSSTLADVQSSGDASSGTHGVVVLLADDGTNYQFMKVDSNRNLLASLGTRLAGENPSGVRGAISDWSEFYKSGTYTSTPTKTTTVIAANGAACTTIGGASCTIIYASTDWLAWPNYCITLRETAGANPVTNVEVEYSPDNTNWERWDSTTFAALGASTMKSLCVAGNAHRYLRIEAQSAAGSTVDAWVTASQN